MNREALKADCVLVLHALFALYAVLGGFLVLLQPLTMVLHLPVVAWSSAVNLMGWTCPLTPLESRLRVRSGQGAIGEGWLKHYIEPALRPLGMPRRMELVAGVSIVVWNAVVYLIVWIALR